MGRHSLKTGLQKIDLFLTVDKTDMRHSIDKVTRLINHPGTNRIRPELFCLFELFENFDRLPYFNFSICSPIRGIAQFTNSGMSGSGIIPSIGTLVGQILSYFIKFNIQVWI